MGDLIYFKNPETDYFLSKTEKNKRCVDLTSSPKNEH